MNAPMEIATATTNTPIARKATPLRPVSQPARGQCPERREAKPRDGHQRIPVDHRGDGPTSREVATIPMNVQ